MVLLRYYGCGVRTCKYRGRRSCSMCFKSGGFGGPLLDVECSGWVVRHVLEPSKTLLSKESGQMTFRTTSHMIDMRRERWRSRKQLSHSTAVSIRPQWLEADVVEATDDGHGLVHFKDYAKKFDVWVAPSGGRVRRFGPYRMPQKGNRSSARQDWLAPGQQHNRHSAQLSSR